MIAYSWWDDEKGPSPRLLPTATDMDTLQLQKKKGSFAFPIFKDSLLLLLRYLLLITITTEGN